MIKIRLFTHITALLFTLWFMKMNEILFVIETEEVIKNTESEEETESEAQEEILDN